MVCHILLVLAGIKFWFNCLVFIWLVESRRDVVVLWADSCSLDCMWQVNHTHYTIVSMRQITVPVSSTC